MSLHPNTNYNILVAAPSTTEINTTSAPFDNTNRIKRATRSQLVLPESLLSGLSLDRSPLKEARKVNLAAHISPKSPLLRANTTLEVHSLTDPDQAMEDVGEERQSQPTKTTLAYALQSYRPPTFSPMRGSQKRNSSPFQEEGRRRSQSRERPGDENSQEGREAKRVKRDRTPGPYDIPGSPSPSSKMGPARTPSLFGNGHLSTPSRTRGVSLPPPFTPRDTYRMDIDRPIEFSIPLRPAHETGTTPGPGPSIPRTPKSARSEGRARSVPPTPVSASRLSLVQKGLLGSASIPHLDLTQLPPSPSKAKRRSSSKSPEKRRAASVLGDEDRFFGGGERQSVEREREIAELGQVEHAMKDSMSVDLQSTRIEGHGTGARTVAEDSAERRAFSGPSVNIAPATPGFKPVSATPAPIAALRPTAPLSPLTPLPETPFRRTGGQGTLLAMFKAQVAKAREKGKEMERAQEKEQEVVDPQVPDPRQVVRISRDGDALPAASFGSVTESNSESRGLSVHSKLPRPAPSKLVQTTLDVGVKPKPGGLVRAMRSRDGTSTKASSSSTSSSTSKNAPAKKTVSSMSTASRNTRGASSKSSGNVTKPAATFKKPVSRAPAQPTRVTRSSSLRDKEQPKPIQASVPSVLPGTQLESEPPEAFPPATLAPPEKPSLSLVEMTRAELLPETSDSAVQKSLVPSFANPTSSSLAKAMPSSPVKNAFPAKAPSSPARRSSVGTSLRRTQTLGTVRPSTSTSHIPSLSRRPSLGDMQPADGISRPVSALSNLSVALEKLAMPPPSRPSTSMGFNRELEDDDEAPAGSSSETKAKDDNGVGRVSAPKDGDLSGPRKTATANDLSIPSGHSIANRGTSLFNRNRGVVGSSVAGQLYPAQGPRKMFGVGGGVGQRASKRSTLPTVAGSPVKGGAAPSMPEADEVSLATPVLSGLSSDQRPIAPLDFSGISMADLLKNPDESAVSEDDAHDPTNPRKGRASRRASLASHMLAQSLSGIPQTPDGTSTMGPPPSLPGRRVASDSQAPIEGAGPATAPAAIGRTRGVGAHVSVHRNTEPSGSNPLPAPSLDVLKECKIFVDVKTDEGDDAGSLFVEMLKGLGAKLTGRVGPRCTHIVYKNGLMSTLTRYRLLNDPKPFVVGIAWVVECVEQRARVDESKFEVDLEGANVAGTNKRRRSMLPKQMSYSADQPTSDEPESESDTSFIGASGGIADTSGKSDSLPPLELARRRRMTNG